MESDLKKVLINKSRIVLHETFGEKTLFIVWLTVS